jgi:RimJ/RimL family protein N-acetyltransferase
MNYSHPPQEILISSKNLILTRIEESDQFFINAMFKHDDIRKNYKLPNLLGSNYQKLASYWSVCIEENMGYTWMIRLKGVGITGDYVTCGFFSYRYNTDGTVLINFALLPIFRGHGLMTVTANTIFEKLTDISIVEVNADISTDNISANKLMVRLGFDTDNKPFMASDFLLSNQRITYLSWKKKLIDFKNLDFFVLRTVDAQQLITHDTTFKLLPETKSNDMDFGVFTDRKQTGRYHLVFQTETAEALVGINPNSKSMFFVTWELTEVNKVGPASFLIFTGWGDPLNDAFMQFEGHRIGIEAESMLPGIRSLIKNAPDIFSSAKMAKVIGLESFSL